MNRMLGKKLIKWYKRAKRDLPWRNTKDPYLIWISEIILQQTRVDQGLPYYQKFINRFENVNELAKADEKEVLNYWQGLGYYSRARNLHTSAKQIVVHFDGNFPTTYKEILKLKGVGPYTAAAISSIAFSEPYPVIDGNVSRVVSRLFGICDAVNSTIGLKVINEKLNTFFVLEEPGNFNQAIMELGALVCKPIAPNCNNCVLSENCFAFNQDQIEIFPIKNKLKAPKKLHLYYFVLKDRDLIYLNKRKSDNIWKNMYDFPGFESDKKRNTCEVITDFTKKYELKNIQPEFLKVKGPVKHQLTHRSIRAFFTEINVDGGFKANEYPELTPVKITDLTNYPLPKLIENYLKLHL